MKRKLFIIVLLLVNLLGLNACKKEEFTITFVNYNGDVLYQTVVEEGSPFSYLGETPIKEADDYYYEFYGWDKKIGLAYENQTFTALFSKTIKEKIVTFKNVDGTIIHQENVMPGKVITTQIDEPTYQVDDKHIEYVFLGWDYDYKNQTITQDITITAQYEINEYVFLNFYDANDALVFSDKTLKGNDYTYPNSDPLKQCDEENYGYKFVGWNNSLNNIVSDTDYYPEFEKVSAYYVTFLDNDGDELYKQKVNEGDEAFYVGLTPTKPSETSGKYTTYYTFDSWDKSLSNVTHSYSVYPTFTSETRFNGPSTRYGSFTVCFVQDLPFSSHTNYNGYTTYSITSFSFDGWGHYSNGIPYVQVSITIERTYGSYSSLIGFGIYDTYNGNSLVCSVKNFYTTKTITERLSFGENPYGTAEVSLKPYYY